MEAWRQAVEDRTRRRAEQAALRADLNRRRGYGLKVRHAAKLNRRQDTSAP